LHSLPTIASADSSSGDYAKFSLPQRNNAKRPLFGHHFPLAKNQTS
jgi:hypothetical protein